jgi:hypothetical protein
LTGAAPADLMRRMSTLSPPPAAPFVEAELANLIAGFFAAVSFPQGGAPSYERLHDLFIPQGLLIRNSGSDPVPAAYGVRAFVNDRAALVAAGRLTSFAEHELSATTVHWGNVAHRLSAYGKHGVQDGVTLAGRGIITTQFVATEAGWRISSMAWDDERPGLPLPDQA